MPPPDLAPPPDSAAFPDLPHIPDGTVISSPCQNGMPSFLYPGGMAICENPVSSVGYNQCNAVNLCGALWHLCTQSEFLLRGGKTTPTSYEAWIAGCIRSGNNVSPPSDGLCGGSCNMGGSATTIPVAWRCDSGASVPSGEKNLGLKSYSSCYEVGAQDPQYGANWRPEAPSKTLKAAVCCL
jgi:hypothetical protein